MSVNTNRSVGGAFATSSRPRAADHLDYIRRRRAEGTPLSAIARMIGCNLMEVQRVAALDVAPPPVELEFPIRTKPLPAIRVRRGQVVKVQRQDEWAETRALRFKEMPDRAKRIVLKIAQQHGVPLEDLIGHRLLKGVARARDHAMYALYATGMYSTPVLGGYFGGRDHTSVLNSLRNHKERQAADLEAWQALGSKSEAA